MLLAVGLRTSISSEYASDKIYMNLESNVQSFPLSFESGYVLQGAYIYAL